MRKLIWVIVAFLVTVISVGAIFYHSKGTPEIIDRRALVELALNDAAKGLPQSKSELILLWTPSLRGVEVPDSIQEVSIRVMDQDEIDALSRVNPVDYIFFWSIVKPDPQSAEVPLSYFLFYRADDPAMDSVYGGKVYFCSKQSGNWIINSAMGWIP
jgi:hypothetical protein